MQYSFANGPQQTTSAFAKVTTGTAIKTMLQGKFTVPVRIVEWGCSLDGSAAATPGQVELIETGTVFATVTAYATADITRYDGEALLFGDPTSSSVLINVGTSASGYTSTSEGSITAVRNLAGPQLIAPTNQFIQQFPLGYRPLVQAGNALRIRMTFGTAVNAYCYCIIEL
jgi:hypothetical protein